MLNQTEVLVLLVTPGDRDEIKPYKRAAVCSGAGGQGTRAFCQRDVARARGQASHGGTERLPHDQQGVGFAGTPRREAQRPPHRPTAGPGVGRVCGGAGRSAGSHWTTRAMPSRRGADGRQGLPDRAPRFSSVPTGLWRGGRHDPVREESVQTPDALRPALPSWAGRRVLLTPVTTQPPPHGER